MTNQTPATVRQDAPDTPAPVVEAEATPPAPRVTIERQGVRSEAVTRRWPQVRGGLCEWCGVMDVNVPSQFQYQLCPHFREIGPLRCSYCDETKDPDEVVGHHNLNIAEHPDKPNSLVVWCDSYDCSRRHEARFKRNA
jgi:hypothetical protein